MGDERRAYERFDLLAQVRVSGGMAHVDYLMDIVNLSRGGALLDLGSIKRPSWIEIDRKVELRLQSPDDGLRIDVRGSIVRILETRQVRQFAVEFDEALDDALVRRACLAAGKPPPLPGR